jgi:integrase
MPKTNIPNYRHHKASGQAFVELGGRRFYLGKHNSKASREEYERRIAEYLGNGRKLPPTRTKTGISCQELAVYFLEWAEEYYVKNGQQTETFDHYRRAVSMWVKHYGNESVNAFTPLSLVFLQKQWIEEDYARLTVNRYVSIIKQAFKHGVKFGWVDAQIHYALQAVDNLKAGRTKAPEYRKIKPVADDVIEKTLPHLSAIVADMVMVQYHGGMRPQDVRNMRSCDIDRSRDVWRYVPHTHKTEHKGKTRIVFLGPKAQAVLKPYLLEKENTPEAFLFSPKDTVRLQNIERRKKRKTFNKSGQVQPSQQDRSRPNASRVGEQYTRDTYNRAISRACEQAGVAHWTPNQLRHTKGTEVRKKYGLEAARIFLGHADGSVTAIYAEPDLEIGEKVAREIG